MRRKVKLTHIVYTDDLMIFCRAYVQSAIEVIEAPQHLSNVSDLVASMEKAYTLMVGVDE